MKKKRDKKDEITELWKFHQAIGQALCLEENREERRGVLPEKGCALIF